MKIITVLSVYKLALIQFLDHRNRQPQPRGSAAGHSWLPGKKEKSWLPGAVTGMRVSVTAYLLQGPPITENKPQRIERIERIDSDSDFVA